MVPIPVEASSRFHNRGLQVLIGFLVFAVLVNAAFFVLVRMADEEALTPL